MQIIKYREADSPAKLKKALPFSDNGCVVALGFFDGVHIAHRALIKEARSFADTKALPLVIFTFSSERDDIKSGVARLYSDMQKCELLSECGADYILLCDFSALSHLDKERFVRDFLVGTLGAAATVCGFNFKFGKGALGNAQDLEHLMRDCGGESLIIPEFTFDGELVSSTGIRRLISNGDMRRAATLLGKPYFLQGKVSHGIGLGTSMGIPTTNTELDSTAASLMAGVYSSVTEIDGKLFRSLTDIGTCPTFGSRSPHAETFILNFDGNLYDSEIKIYLLDYLREEKVFSGEEELIMQIKVDIKKADSLVKEIKWQEIGLNSPLR